MKVDSGKVDSGKVNSGKVNSGKVDSGSSGAGLLLTFPTEKMTAGLTRQLTLVEKHAVNP